MRLFLCLWAFCWSVTFLQAQTTTFSWPEGKKAALCLSFDDARLSNVDVGLDLFKKYGVAVTYYVVPSGVRQRLDQWKQAVRDGHEIGNHTLVHPCSENFDWARSKGLETYNLAAMRRELTAANREIQELLGVTPASFAYSCGQTYVGRGAQTQSYVPLVAELFESGRGWLDEAPNDPMFADFSQLMGVESDGKDFETQIRPMLDEAVKNGKWLILGGHEIGVSGPQTTRVKMLEALIQYAQRPNSGIWLTTVGEAARYVKQQRREKYRQLADQLTFLASFDKGPHADFAEGDKNIYSGKQAGLTAPGVHLAPNKGRFGHALAFTQIAKPPLYFSAHRNVRYDDRQMQGTVSLWLSLDPEQELEPGYCDPIQITDVTYNDAAIWVDFSDKNPRLFRMGVFGDLKVWNPNDTAPDDNPDFNNRLVVAEDRPFGKEIWTHIVIVYENLNQKGKAKFYVNGRFQGERDIPEPFTWEPEKAQIYLGLNYTGLMDEVAVFEKAFTEEEINLLYRSGQSISEWKN